MPVKGPPLLPTMRLPPGVLTSRKQVHNDSLPPSKSDVPLMPPEVRTPQKEVPHDNLPPSKADVALLGRPHQDPAALAPAQCYSQIQHSPAVHYGKRPFGLSQSYGRGGGLAAAVVTVLHRRRCISAPSQRLEKGRGLAAAAATALYCGRRCSSAPSQS